MDNKYGLGSAKVAYAHHEATHKPALATTAKACCHCGYEKLTYCPTLEDHYCEACGEYQNDIPVGYATGHSANY